MIQRVQTLYLLLAAVLQTVCLCRPVGLFLGEDGELLSRLFNLWTSSEDGTHSLAPWALFAILLIAATLTLISVFLFRTRALQMRAVSLSMVLLVGYYAYLVVFVWLHLEGVSYRPTVATALPLVSIILLFLAFRGILKDELLVRSLDRLR
ncbi:MAG: DUF4293 domain-containing protein [Prevotellaceae bacterium]|nr:DUF4293 domain-containing protein [Prevotellaceae bacterium]